MFSDYTGKVAEEDATGWFHASLASGRDIFDRIGTWPLTKRGDFDQQLIARLHSLGALGDPCLSAVPSCVLRWSSTGAYDGQTLITGPDDESWYCRNL